MRNLCRDIAGSSPGLPRQSAARGGRARRRRCRQSRCAGFPSRVRPARAAGAGGDRRTTGGCPWKYTAATAPATPASHELRRRRAAASGYDYPFRARRESGGTGVTRCYTIGHSTRPLPEVLELLQAHGVTRLVDVRRFPGSRRNPQYGGEVLADALADAGIAYIHEPGLGGRRPARPESLNTYWRDAGFRGYADYMSTPEFATALHALEALAAEGVTALMCAEAVPWRCHRQLVADALVAGGHEVAHIIGRGEVRPHVLNPAARVGPGGALTYPGAAGEEGGGTA